MEKAHLGGGAPPRTSERTPLPGREEPIRSVSPVQLPRPRARGGKRESQLAQLQHSQDTSNEDVQDGNLQNQDHDDDQDQDHGREKQHSSLESPQNGEKDDLSVSGGETGGSHPGIEVADRFEGNGAGGDDAVEEAGPNPPQDPKDRDEAQREEQETMASRATGCPSDASLGEYHTLAGGNRYSDAAIPIPRHDDENGGGYPMGPAALHSENADRFDVPIGVQSVGVTVTTGSGKKGGDVIRTQSGRVGPRPDAHRERPHTAATASAAGIVPPSRVPLQSDRRGGRHLRVARPSSAPMSSRPIVQGSIWDNFAPLGSALTAPGASGQITADFGDGPVGASSSNRVPEHGFEGRVSTYEPARTPRGLSLRGSGLRSPGRGGASDKRPSTASEAIGAGGRGKTQSARPFSSTAAAHSTRSVHSARSARSLHSNARPMSSRSNRSSFGSPGRKNGGGKRTAEEILRPMFDDSVPTPPPRVSGVVVSSSPSTPRSRNAAPVEIVSVMHTMTPTWLAFNQGYAEEETADEPLPSDAIDDLGIVEEYAGDHGDEYEDDGETAAITRWQERQQRSKLNNNGSNTNNVYNGGNDSSRYGSRPTTAHATASDSVATALPPRSPSARGDRRIPESFSVPPRRRAHVAAGSRSVPPKGTARGSLPPTVRHGDRVVDSIATSGTGIGDDPANPANLNGDELGGINGGPDTDEEAVDAVRRRAREALRRSGVDNSNNNNNSNNGYYHYDDYVSHSNNSNGYHSNNNSDFDLDGHPGSELMSERHARNVIPPPPLTPSRKTAGADYDSQGRVKGRKPIVAGNARSLAAESRAQATIAEALGRAYEIIVHEKVTGDTPVKSPRLTRAYEMMLERRSAYVPRNRLAEKFMAEKGPSSPLRRGRNTKNRPVSMMGRPGPVTSGGGWGAKNGTGRPDDGGAATSAPRSRSVSGASAIPAPRSRSVSGASVSGSRRPTATSDVDMVTMPSISVGERDDTRFGKRENAPKEGVKWMAEGPGEERDHYAGIPF